MSKSYIGNSDFWYGLAGLCLEQAQPFHSYELSGPVHLYCCLLTMGKYSFSTFLECHISLLDSHIKLFLWWAYAYETNRLSYEVMTECLWDLKCVILMVAHHYIHVREMRYLVAWFLKTTLLHLGGPHDINDTFIVFRLYFSVQWSKYMLYFSENLWAVAYNCFFINVNALLLLLWNTNFLHDRPVTKVLAQEGRAYFNTLKFYRNCVGRSRLFPLLVFCQLSFVLALPDLRCEII